MGTLTNSLNPKFAVFFLLSIFFFSCSQEEIAPDAPFDANLSISSNDIIKDQYIVLLSKKSTKDDPRAEAALEALSKEVRNMKGARVKGKFKHSVSGFVAKLSPQQVEQLKKDKRVISITPDRFVDLESATITNTTTVQEYVTWGLDRMDQRGSLLDRAYAYNSTGAGVNVYIMDSGIKYSHSEFGNRASLGIDLVREYPDELYDKDDPNVIDGDDCSGHGTHVAGTVGGDKYGMAKGVNLISVRVFSCYGRTTWSRILLAVDWITFNAVKPAVVNMSLGDVLSTDADPVELAIENSIDAGINYVVSAGNMNMEVCDYTPARVSKAITVGASDISNKRASFSNYGSCLDLYAPGVSITSAGIVDDNSVAIGGGTSMAAPHVTGIVALYLEKNPEATAAEVHSAIIDNATPNAILEVPSGPANIAHSLWEAVDFTPPPAPTIEIQGFLSKVRKQHAISIQWTTPEEPSHVVYRDGIAVARFDNGKNNYLEYTELKNATFVYKVCGVNYDNCSRELTVVIGNGGDTATPTNSPPLSYFSYTANWQDVQFKDESSDGDGSVVEWLWDFGDGNSSTAQNPSHRYASAGNYFVYLTVKDDRGASSESYKNIYVYSQNPAPVELELTVDGRKDKGQWTSNLWWTVTNSSTTIDVYRNGTFLETVDNNGSYADPTGLKGSGTLKYKICETGTTACSNEVTISF